MEFEEAGPHLIIHNGIQVCCDDPLRQGSKLDQVFLKDMLHPLMEQ